MRRARVVVDGMVQGVFYRAVCAERARELGVSGWVRNVNDGRVEAVFQGDEDDVEAMIEWCRLGPPLAAVSSVEVVDEPIRSEPGFHVTS
jgi:acylphosphatase